LCKESPEVQELFDRILDCLPLALKLTAVGLRSAGVKYANESDLTSGDGAGYYGVLPASVKNFGRTVALGAEIGAGGQPAATAGDGETAASV